MNGAWIRSRLNMPPFISAVRKNRSGERLVQKLNAYLLIDRHEAEKDRCDAARSAMPYHRA